MTRAFGSEMAYSEAVSNVQKFNTRFLRERRQRLRLPFVDSQTHIIQSPTQTFLWREPVQRLMPERFDQVTSYARRLWRKKRVHLPNTAPPPLPPPFNNEVNGQAMDTSNVKENLINGEKQQPGEDDPRVIVRASELGKSFPMAVSLHLFFIAIVFLRHV
jgi:hypothetical protein